MVPYQRDLLRLSYINQYPFLHPTYRQFHYCDSSHPLYPLLLSIKHLSPTSDILGNYRQSPTYYGSTQDFLALQWCGSDMHSRETILGLLDFDPFLGQRYVVGSSLVMLGSSSEWQLLVSHVITRVNNYSVPIQPFCFSLSLQQSMM